MCVCDVVCVQSGAGVTAAWRPRSPPRRAAAAEPAATRCRSSAPRSAGTEQDQEHEEAAITPEAPERIISWFINS